MSHAPSTAARRIRLGLALLGLMASQAPAHAAYPGENGPIVFSHGGPPMIARVMPGQPGITTLTDGFSPRVSPNGRKIAFLKGEPSKGKDVYVMDIDGSNPVRLTNDARTWAVAWSADGTRLAYVTDLNRNASFEWLWVMQADGTGTRLPVNLYPPIRKYSLEWSPVSDDFAFIAWNGSLEMKSPDSIYAKTIAGSAQGPSWTPDGKSLLYRNGTIMQVQRDGTGNKTIANIGGEVRVVMSPDGKQLATGNTEQQLVTVRLPAGQVSMAWPMTYGNNEVDWARVPKNCHVKDTQGNSGVLAGDLQFYAEECAIAVSPGTTQTNGVLAQAFAAGPDGRLYARMLRRSSPGGTLAWDQPTLVPGGGGHTGGIRPLKVAAAAARDGSFQVVIINAADNALYHAIQLPSGAWSGFQRLDGWNGAPSFEARDVAIAINGSSTTSPGALQVMANGLAAGNLFHRVRTPAGSWSAFAQIPGSVGMTTQALAIASSDDLFTNALAIRTAPDGSQAQIVQAVRDPAGNWGAWVTVPMAPGFPLSASSDIAVSRAPWNGGRASLVVLDAEGQAWVQVRDKPNLLSSWQSIEPGELVGKEVRSVSLSVGSQSAQILITRADPQ